MQIIVLMGGMGTRLGNLTLKTPKSMIKINNKPFFEYQLEVFKSQGFRNFLFCVGYKNEVVEEYFGNGYKFGVNIKYSYDTDKLLGTGGAIKRAINLIEDKFLLIYGDSYLNIDYNKLINFYNSNNNKNTMVIYKNKDKLDKSNVKLIDNSNNIFYDKINNINFDYIDAGVSVLNKDILGLIPNNEFYDLANIINYISKEELLIGYKINKRFYEIGTLQSLNEFNDFLNRGEYHNGFI